MGGGSDEMPSVYGRLDGMERVANPDALLNEHPTHKEKTEMRITRQKKFIIAGVVALGLLGGGGAIAYWTTTGTGTGSATVGTSSTVTVTQLGTITALTPGSTAQNINFRIHNPAATNQTIATVAVSISGVTGPNISIPLPCSAADFTLVQPTAINTDLTPGDHDYAPSGATLALNNSGTNQDGCKNATVALAFAAS